MGVSHFAAPGRGMKVDAQSVNVVCLPLKVIGKLLHQGFGIVRGFTSPFGGDYIIQVVVDNGLFFISADAIDQVDQIAVEYIGNLAYQFFLGLITGALARVCSRWLAYNFQRFLFHPVAINGIEQFTYNRQQGYTARFPGDAGTPFVVQLFVQSCQASSQGRYSIRIAGAHHYAHGQVFHGHAGLRD